MKYYLFCDLIDQRNLNYLISNHLFKGSIALNKVLNQLIKGFNFHKIEVFVLTNRKENKLIKFPTPKNFYIYKGFFSSIYYLLKSKIEKDNTLIILDPLKIKISIVGFIFCLFYKLSFTIFLIVLS